MKYLTVKLTSFGDIIHALPALTDAAKAYPHAEWHWAVEEKFQQLLCWHRAAPKIIPVAQRRWRHTRFSKQTRQEIKALKDQLRAAQYDAIIDLQGLLKSAMIARLAEGPRYGLSWSSAREPLASLFYQKRFKIAKNQHAIHRNRQLMADALDYTLSGPIDYGLNISATDIGPIPDVLFIIGSAWDSKCYPSKYWAELSRLLENENYSTGLVWGSAAEQQKAQAIANICPAVVMPTLDLTGLASAFKQCKAVVSVDTGPGHLATAVGATTLGLYGPTSADKTGILGPNQISTSAEFPCAPCFNRQCTYQGRSDVQPACFTSLPPSAVLAQLKLLMGTSDSLY